MLETFKQSINEIHQVDRNSYEDNLSSIMSSLNKKDDRYCYRIKEESH